MIWTIITIIAIGVAIVLSVFAIHSVVKFVCYCGDAGIGILETIKARFDAKFGDYGESAYGFAIVATVSVASIIFLSL